MLDNLPMTVAHFNPATKRWHVESTGTPGQVWSSDFWDANTLSKQYREYGFESIIITSAQLTNRVENLPFSGSLVAVDGVFPNPNR
jgi:hypothetical protein